MESDNRALVKEEIRRLLDDNAISLLSARNSNSQVDGLQPRHSFASTTEERVHIFQPLRKGPMIRGEAITRGAMAMRGREGAGTHAYFCPSIPSWSFSKASCYRPTVAGLQTCRRGGCGGSRPRNSSPYARPQPQSPSTPQVCDVGSLHD